MALSSYNTVIKKSGTALAEVTSISVGGSSLVEIDTTSLTSTSKEFVMGALDAGTCTVEMFAPANYTGATGSDLEDLVPTSGDAFPDTYVIEFARDGSNVPTMTATFDAYITNCSVSAAMDGAVTASVTLKIETAIVWA